jgi:hypothetical protein
METIYDFKIGQKVEVMWFGEPHKMKVIGHDEETNQVRLQHLDAYGSFYVTPQQIELDKKRCIEFRMNHDMNDLGGTGHGDISYSDADPGL